MWRNAIGSIALICGAALPGAASAKNWRPIKCAPGYYSYVPKNPNKEVGFSVSVQPTAIEVQWIDFGHIFAQKRRSSHVSLGITFSDSGDQYCGSAFNAGPTAIMG